jgi:hypothetical protein
MSRATASLTQLISTPGLKERNLCHQINIFLIERIKIKLEHNLNKK